MIATDDRLRELYGRVEPYGTLERGDGSERCLVCGVRNAAASYYVWLPGPMPVCSAEHAEHAEQLKAYQATA